MLLHEKLAPYRLLLASQSPRRRELMSGCGLPYELAPKFDCEERYPAPLAAWDILLTADTVVVLDGEVLGKPRGRDEAVEMLGRLSARRHTVVSGVTFRTRERMHTFTAHTSVWFRRLEREEIDYYVDTFRPFDKAGSYGIQEWIGYAAIERIEGSFYNVMGLPIQKLYVELDQFLNT